MFWGVLWYLDFPVKEEISFATTKNDAIVQGQRTIIL